ncbi:hypothetical protein N7466_009229 [Penicillium verhagenii]|uniref:uncharacterized protein n=1 Tax=Penicillium verhagenii TaxID=1562060 RepID=UPI002544F69C|nr:uncharacterized protein N7466_009229 [Penicillium verhagenii]KAJ5920903.1 hypothetical protein N7466_009229 [Penicillium verhagenii]
MASPNSPSTLSADNLTVLPPILTDATVKPSPSAKDRLSTYSNLSLASQHRSRPGSHIFPVFHSSLPYALVRDFAYPTIHPFHYGPPPLPSGGSTPASEYRRLSDLPNSWESARGPWASGPFNNETSQSHGPGHGQGHQQLPAMSFGDGPPYSEDEDLHSPVVTTVRQRNKSIGTDSNGMTDEYMAEAADRGMFISVNPDGSETYYVNSDDAMTDGPGGEYVTYPVNESRYSHYDTQQGHAPDVTSEDNGDRYANDYQFAVGCPDEEMHGKAVALFDFTREHENELPLTEGQVVYVSYRHGHGWLVAEDPTTGENGLVPEEFVRLLRDIEGGLTSLNGEPISDSTESSTSIDMTEDDRTSTPTQDDSTNTNGDTPMTISVEGTNETNQATGGSAGSRVSIISKT